MNKEDLILRCLKELLIETNEDRTKERKLLIGFIDESLLTPEDLQELFKRREGVLE